MVSLVYHTGAGKLRRKKIMDVRKGGQALKATRERLGWTQKQLADKAGIRQQKLSDIESGVAARPDMEYLMKVGKALGLDANRIAELYEV